jgi:hypothetical protein
MTIDLTDEETAALMRLLNRQSTPIAIRYRRAFRP